MSLMTTKMVVQKKLRELIHPELQVVNVDGMPENEMPADAYTGAKETQKDKQEDEKMDAPKHGVMDNLKKIVGLS